VFGLTLLIGGGAGALPAPWWTDGGTTISIGAGLGDNFLRALELSAAACTAVGGAMAARPALPPVVLTGSGHLPRVRELRLRGFL